MTPRALLLAIAGCYAPTVPAGVACDPASPSCPAGQVCIERAGGYVCSAPVPADGAIAKGDGDGDGVVDEVDNCPDVANANQANEDADRLGDACDPCPPFADTSPVADGDADGVSDACDPRPAMAGDQIVFFEGFGAGIPVGWSAEGGWVTANGSVSVDATAETSRLTVPGPTTLHETLSTSVKIDAIEPNADASVGLVNAYNITDGIGVYCHLTRYATAQPLVVNQLQSQGAISQNTSFEMAVTATYTMRFRRDSSAFGCQAGRDTTSATTPTLTSDRGPQRVGLRGSNVKATFAWMMVVGNP